MLRRFVHRCIRIRSNQTQIQATRRNRDRRNEMQLTLETLEDRVMLSLSSWVPEGPAPGETQNAAVDGNFASGAVQTVAAHPSNKDIVYVGSVNGGIWKTESATFAVDGKDNDGDGTTDEHDEVIWTPQTDDLPSMSIGAIQFGKTQTGANDTQTLIAGTGRFSNFGLNSQGDDTIGVYYTTNGGKNWTNFGDPILRNGHFTNVAARGRYLFAASKTEPAKSYFEFTTDHSKVGLFRSVDAGKTWQHLNPITATLPPMSIFDMVGDPNDPDRFYVAGTAGIYRTENAFATVPTWTPITGIVPLRSTVPVTGGNIVLPVQNMRMAIHTSAGKNVVYVTPVLYDNSKVGGVAGYRSLAVYRSENFSAFRSMGDPNVYRLASPQGIKNASIAADPTNPNVVYVGGDSAGEVFHANLKRGTYSATLGTTWTSIANATGTFVRTPGGFKYVVTSGSAPHADSRWMVFDREGYLLQSDDGGIYRLANPTTANATTDRPRWTSNNGNLQLAEVHDVVYDSVSHTIVVGTQDNGVQVQTAAGSQVWKSINGGDGGDVASAPRNATQSFRYFSSQYLGDGFIIRETVDVDGKLLERKRIDVRVKIPESERQFVTPIELNAVNPRKMLIGGRTKTFELNALELGGEPNIAPAVRALNLPVNGSDVGNPMVYGGRIGTTPNENLIYYADGSDVWKRFTAGAPFGLAAPLPGVALTDFVTDLAISPTNYNQVFALTNNRVFISNNAGGGGGGGVPRTTVRAGWTDITGNLLQVVARNGGAGTGAKFHQMAVIPNAPGKPNGVQVVVGTRAGVFVLDSFVAGFALWKQFGQKLPDVPVFSLDYDAADDVLVAGTLGRGVFTLPDARLENGVDNALHQVVGNNNANNFVVRRAAGNDTIIEVRTDGALVESFTDTPNRTLNIFGFGGNDTLTIDHSNGDPTSLLTVQFIGGDGDDEMKVSGYKTTGTIEIKHTSATNGNVQVGASKNANFFQLEAMSLEGKADRIAHEFSTSSETITVDDKGNGKTEVNSNLGPRTTFTNPDTRLGINAGDAGADTINVNSFNMAARLIIDGQGGTDTINVNGNVNTGSAIVLTAENINVAPNANVTSGAVLIFNALQNIVLNAGSTVTSNSDIYMEAKQQTMIGGTLRTDGTGKIRLFGATGITETVNGNAIIGPAFIDGTLSPGLNATSAFDVDGSVEFSTNARYDVTINGAASDRLNVNGNNRTTTLTGVRLNVILTPAPKTGSLQKYTIVSSTGTGSKISGVFKNADGTANLTDGTYFNVGKTTFRINYYTGSVTLTEAGAPVLAGITSKQTYKENAHPKILAPQALVSDPGSADFAGGNVIVRQLATALPTDILAVRNQGTKANQISVLGNKIRFVTKGFPANILQEIGTFSGGKGNTPLVIRLNANATPKIVSFLLRNITFQNTSDNPTDFGKSPIRNLQYTVNDGDGGTSKPVKQRLIITAVNDTPVVTGITSTQTYVENAAAKMLAPRARVSDPDSGNFAGGNVIVRQIATALSTDILAIRNQGKGNNQISVVGNKVNYSLRGATQTIGTFSGGKGVAPLVIRLNANATASKVLFLLRNITYQNTSDNPTNFGKSPIRNLQYTVNDGDGGTSKPIKQRLVIKAVNDVPVVTGIRPIETYQNLGEMLLAPLARVSDLDSINFQKGTLVVQITSGAVSTDQLGVRNQGTGNNQISVVRNQVRYSLNRVTQTIGTFSGGRGAAPLVIRFNANATPSKIAYLLRNITYLNTSDNATNFGKSLFRSMRYTLNDGDGGTSKPFSQRLDVAALTIRGTTRNDVITVDRGSKAGTVTVKINSSVKTFAVPRNGIIAAFGARGNDTITFSSRIANPAYLSGGPGNDTLMGGRGSDIINGDAGTNFNNASGGIDTLLNVKGVVLFGTPGNDHIEIEWYTDDARGPAVLFPPFPHHNDFLSAHINGKEIEMVYNPDQNDDQPTVVVYAGDGNDTVIMSDDGAGQHWNAEFHGGRGNDTLIGATKLFSNPRGNDRMFGDAGNDTLLGNAGNDYLDGGTGNDIIKGGIGNDKLMGDSGNDRLYGEDDNDDLSGGSGNDLLDGGNGNDNLKGDGGNDLLIDFSGINKLNGGPGRDIELGRFFSLIRSFFAR